MSITLLYFVMFHVTLSHVYIYVVTMSCICSSLNKILFCSVLFFSSVFLNLSINYVKKKMWLVIKSDAGHPVCDSLSFTGYTNYPA